MPLSTSREAKMLGSLAQPFPDQMLFRVLKGARLGGGFPQWLSGQESACSVGGVGDSGSIPGLGGFPWRRKWQPTYSILTGKSHGQRSLVGYSLWGPKELDGTERLSSPSPWGGRDSSKFVCFLEAFTSKQIGGSGLGRKVNHGGAYLNLEFPE